MFDTRKHNRTRRASSAGFTLIELAVTVTIIGILAMLAFPQMGDAQRERRAYDDAGQVVELVRTARTRALGRGAAQMVTFDTITAGAARGNFRLYEGVSPNPGGAVDATSRIPRSSCTLPATGWAPSNPANTFIDGVTLNGNYELSANIMSRVVTFGVGGIPALATGVVALCYTPLGRTYYWSGASGATPQFSAAAPFLGTLAIDVVRLFDGQSAIAPTSVVGITRRVLVPSSGNTRMLSTLALPGP